mmetsp:Transcript_26971/g.56675  ORF Transcript_26971/g.56675 Transcript_26971/m.56675 type:complete len:247 (-) Transcript_26971:867-1607(-)
MCAAQRQSWPSKHASGANSRSAACRRHVGPTRRTPCQMLSCTSYPAPITTPLKSGPVVAAPTLLPVGSRAPRPAVAVSRDASTRRALAAVRRAAELRASSHGAAFSMGARTTFRPEQRARFSARWAARSMPAVPFAPRLVARARLRHCRRRASVCHCAGCCAGRRSRLPWVFLWLRPDCIARSTWSRRVAKAGGSLRLGGGSLRLGASGGALRPDRKISTNGCRGILGRRLVVGRRLAAVPASVAT